MVFQHYPTDRVGDVALFAVGRSWHRMSQAADGVADVSVDAVVAGADVGAGDVPGVDLAEQREEHFDVGVAVAVAADGRVPGTRQRRVAVSCPDTGEDGVPVRVSTRSLVPVAMVPTVP